MIHFKRKLPPIGINNVECAFQNRLHNIYCRVLRKGCVESFSKITFKTVTISKVCFYKYALVSSGDRKKKRGWKVGLLNTSPRPVYSSAGPSLRIKDVGFREGWWIRVLISETTTSEGRKPLTMYVLTQGGTSLTCDSVTKTSCVHLDSTKHIIQSTT